MRRVISPWVTGLAVVVLLLAGFGTGFGAGWWYRTIAPPYIGGSEDARQKFIQLQGEMKDLVDDARRADRLISVLLAITSLYSVALGLNAYFGLKQTLENAREETKRLTDEVQDRYPAVAAINSNLLAILTEFGAIFDNYADWTEHAYRYLSWTKRSEIMIAESRFAGLEVFRLDSRDDHKARIARICQGLGRFYSSKFTLDGDRLDWERASHYFTRALHLNSGPVVKDAGVHMIQREVRTAGPFQDLPPEEQRELEALRKKAVDFFNECLKSNKNDPGSLFGLAWIEYRRMQFGSAIQHYEKICAIRKWKEGERHKYLADAHRNAACCRYLKREDPEAIVRDLLQSRKIAQEENIFERWKDDVAGDEELTAFFREQPEARAAVLL